MVRVFTAAPAPILPRALLLLLVVAGCDVPAAEPPGILLAANAAAIPVVHRSLFDVVYSALTGKDCSVVRLDRMQTYCRPIEPPPPPPQYCTRSLGVVDCWAEPLAPPTLGRPVADGPSRLTPAQEQDRTRPWPPL
jgi:hypothetical protein